MRTGFDKIATQCRKISKCIRCWDWDTDYYDNCEDNYNYMTVEVELENPRAKFSDDCMLALVQEVIAGQKTVECYKAEYVGGSDYDSYTIWLKEKTV